MTKCSTLKYVILKASTSRLSSIRRTGTSHLKNPKPMYLLLLQGNSTESLLAFSDREVYTFGSQPHVISTFFSDSTNLLLPASYSLIFLVMTV